MATPGWETLRAILAAALLHGGGPAAVAAEDPFAANVRPTDPLTPEEQQKAFRTPPGFKVQLVAREPDINKPMNLAFDALGRLWVTTSREYPHPAPLDRPGRDRVMVFEDFGPDGLARKVTEFAGGLNIPTGVYPFRSPNADGRETWKAIVWSIPHIWLMEDTDGDGRADTRERLYGPFDHTRDTHGNQSSFRRGFDGWLYATHGYNNDSRVAGRDGHGVRMHSGNTYRMLLNGQRIEHHTWGQVNPFGLAWDPQGNLYSSDCHSEPIYLLQAGGYYPSFGKPHDGLGFAPNMMERIRGSTAIDGISYYADDLWPEEYRDSVFIGDVMTSRVYRDLAAPRGSGRVARAQPDFVISEDPWFRPVDTTLGPDGALYIADFYNRIIGHYEVPLNHPGRDRERGRIWRVVPTEKALRSPALAQDMPGLIRELASPSLPRRLLAMNDLHDRFGAKAIEGVRAAFDRPENPEQAAHALWLLARLRALRDGDLAKAAGDPSPLVRIHAMRVLAEAARLDAVAGNNGRGTGYPAEWDRLILQGLQDATPEVQRCAVEAAGVRVQPQHLDALLALRRRVTDDDPHLLYGVRQALRNLLRQDAVLASVIDRELPPKDLAALIDVAPATPTELAARFLLRHFDSYSDDAAFTEAALSHAARHCGQADLDRLVQIARGRGGQNLDLQSALFRSVRQGFEQRGVALPDKAQDWALELAGRLLDSAGEARAWRFVPLEDFSGGINPWESQERSCADGTVAQLISSHPRGENLTGRLQSPPFPAPARLSFYLCGHDGPPDVPAQGRNKARLLDARTGEVLLEAAAPRNDVARKIEWDLASLERRRVIFEVVDADPGQAYAWIAVGRFEAADFPKPGIAPATAAARQVAAAEIAGAAEKAAQALQSRFRELARDERADLSARSAAGRVIATEPAARALALLVGDAAQPFGWRKRLAEVAFGGRDGALSQFETEVWAGAPHRFQVALARGLAAETPRAAQLVFAMRDGKAPTGLLQDRALRERMRRLEHSEARQALEALEASLPDEDAAAQQLLEQRRAAFARAKPSPERGREVFALACAVCHKIGSEGGTVGPQLTGIGTRGAERLSEDILVPNRNLDHAFFTTVLELSDGESVSGLFRREEGESIVLATAAGTEFSVPKADVVERRETRVSIMPSNFGEALSEEQFADLLGFLLEQKGTN